MASSAAGSLGYWCHQCNTQTRPSIGGDVVCTFCNQGFIEELESTEIEPGLAFSSLPRPFGNFLGMASPASTGITRDSSPAVTPSTSHQVSPFPPSSSSLVSPSTTQPQMQCTSSGLQGHRPRILSGQLSGVPSLLEAMMQAIMELDNPITDEHSRFEGLASYGDVHGVHARLHLRQNESQDASEDSSHSGATHSPTQSASEDGGGPVFVLPFPLMLIFRGDTPNGFRTLEVFVDNGQGMGPQMMPNQNRDYFRGPDLERLIQMLAENDPNRYGTPPAAKSELEKLPKFKITEEHLASSVSCAVCKDECELDIEVLQMPCKHVYHPDCILPWLAEHNSCPVCRFELPTDDADYEASKRQTTSAQTNANPAGTGAEEQGGGGVPITGNVDGSPGLRPFMLWGMPAMVGLNPFARTEGQSDSARRAEVAQGQDASRGDRSPVQWLFRLFSSGSDDVLSMEPGNRRSPSGT